MERLSNRVALVTGSSRGIGREIAVALAAVGRPRFLLESDGSSR